MVWTSMPFAVGMACSGLLATEACFWLCRRQRWAPAIVGVALLWALLPETYALQGLAILLVLYNGAVALLLSVEHRRLRRRIRRVLGIMPPPVNPESPVHRGRSSHLSRGA